MRRHLHRTQRARAVDHGKLGLWQIRTVEGSPGTLRYGIDQGGMGTGERKVFFFEKKKQKTFIRWDVVI